MKVAYRRNVFCKIRFDGERLSITGVEGPKATGRCFGAFGQIVVRYYDKLSNKVTSLDDYSNGWNDAQWMKFIRIWNLNDMHAKTLDQAVRLYRDGIVGKNYDYNKACRALEEAGIYNDNGYRYGHGWVSFKVSENVLEFLVNLPDTEIHPAWV